MERNSVVERDILIEAPSPKSPRRRHQPPSDNISEFGDAMIRQIYRKKNQHHTPRKTIDNFKQYVTKIMNAPPQFVGMERINYDENKKLGWNFFSNHLFNKLSSNEYARNIEQQSQKDSFGSTQRGSIVLQMMNNFGEAAAPMLAQQPILNLYQSESHKQPVTNLEELKQFKDDIHEKLELIYTARASQQLRRESSSFSSMMRQQQSNTHSLKQVQPKSSMDSLEDFQIESSNFKFRASILMSPDKRKQVQDKLGNDNTVEQVQKDWRYSSLQANVERQLNRSQGDYLDVDLSDPFALGDDAKLLMPDRPLFLQVRRRSCCCERGCKLYKEPKGLQIVLEQELIGKRLLYKQIIVKATQLLAKKSDKHKSSYALQVQQNLENMITKKYKSILHPPFQTQALPTPRHLEELKKDSLQIETKKTRVSNLRAVVQKQISNRKAGTEQQIQRETNTESNFDESSISEFDDLELLLQQDLTSVDDNKQVIEQPYLRKLSLVKFEDRLQQSIEEEQKSPSPRHLSQKKIKSKFMNSIRDNEKQRVSRAFSSIDTIKSLGDLHLSHSMNRQVSLRRELSIQKRKEQENLARLEIQKRIKQLFNANLITSQGKDIGPFDMSDSTSYLSKRKKASLPLNNDIKTKILSNIFKKIPGKLKSFQPSESQLLNSKSTYLNRLTTQSNNIKQIHLMTSRGDKPLNSNRNLLMNEDLSISSLKMRASITHEKLPAILEKKIQSKSKHIVVRHISVGRSKQKKNPLL